MVAFKHVIDELSDSLCRNKTISIEKGEGGTKLFNSITSTMSDGGAVNPPFNRMLANIRDDFLPGVMENWDGLSEENKIFVTYNKLFLQNAFSWKFSR